MYKPSLQDSEELRTDARNYDAIKYLFTEIVVKSYDLQFGNATVTDQKRKYFK